MDSSTLLSLFITMTAAILPSTGASASNPNCSDLVTSSCKMTPHPDICLDSLCSYSCFLQAKKPQKQKKELVKAAVNVTLTNAKNMTAWAVKFSRDNRGLNGTEGGALSDCVENFGDTVDQIHDSLAELKHLRSESFKFQMSNVQTWMSAALTNEDSCLDGFEGVPDGRVKGLVEGKVQYAEKLMSNALSLINWLASSARYSKVGLWRGRHAV
ncbi:hypothetical protein SUGI_0013650 [Cryptomeria japonica]|uniref:pectinesterase inhibitor 9 n=1 Tax=Cryptomeria japonica TaxID=3369 RepID=UPI002408B10B|nr:pectinesterase inhibitor 9 [Cryptomeria japonica]GLJ05204.1 hypothetical protein SUGI_0013650 [Cryptomeria japonica]